MLVQPAQVSASICKSQKRFAFTVPRSLARPRRRGIEARGRLAPKFLLTAIAPNRPSHPMGGGSRSRLVLKMRLRWTNNPIVAMVVLITDHPVNGRSCPSTDPARLRGGELALRRCVAAAAF